MLLANEAVEWGTGGVHPEFKVSWTIWDGWQPYATHSMHMPCAQNCTTALRIDWTDQIFYFKHFYLFISALLLSLSTLSLLLSEYWSLSTVSMLIIRLRPIDLFSHSGVNVTNLHSGLEEVVILLWQIIYRNVIAQELLKNSYLLKMMVITVPDTFTKHQFDDTHGMVWGESNKFQSHSLLHSNAFDWTSSWHFLSPFPWFSFSSLRGK